MFSQDTIKYIFSQNNKLHIFTSHDKLCFTRNNNFHKVKSLTIWALTTRVSIKILFNDIEI